MLTLQSIRMSLIWIKPPATSKPSLPELSELEMLFATCFISFIKTSSYQWVGFSTQVKKTVLSNLDDLSTYLRMFHSELLDSHICNHPLSINTLPHLKYDNEAARRFQIVTIRRELMSDKYRPPVNLVSLIQQPDLLCFWPDFLVELHDILLF